MKQDKQTSSVGDISLTASVLARDRLKISYELENRGSAAWVVFDALHRYSGDVKKYDPNLAFVFASGHALRVSRMVPPLPDAFDVEEAYVPWTRVLPAGGKLSGQVDLAIPVAEYSPYFLDEGSAVSQILSNVQLVIGVCELSDTARLAEVIGLRNIYVASHLGPNCQNLSVLWQVEGLRALVRTDEFERF